MVRDLLRRPNGTGHGIVTLVLIGISFAQLELNEAREVMARRNIDTVKRTCSKCDDASVNVKDEFDGDCDGDDDIVAIGDLLCILFLHLFA